MHYAASCHHRLCITLLFKAKLLVMYLFPQTTRTQYYYYNKWTRQRISDLAPRLPEPVVVKLLGTDANDLDLLLQHPAGLRAQVSHLQTEGCCSGNSIVRQSSSADLHLSWLTGS